MGGGVQPYLRNQPRPQDVKGVGREVEKHPCKGLKSHNTIFVFSREIFTTIQEIMCWLAPALQILILG